MFEGVRRVVLVFYVVLGVICSVGVEWRGNRDGDDDGVGYGVKGICGKKQETTRGERIRREKPHVYQHNPQRGQVKPSPGNKPTSRQATPHFQAYTADRHGASVSTPFAVTSTKGKNRKIKTRRRVIHAHI